jgi:hypothetical protein
MIDTLDGQMYVVDLHHNLISISASADIPPHAPASRYKEEFHEMKVSHLDGSCSSFRGTVPNLQSNMCGLRQILHSPLAMTL